VAGPYGFTFEPHDVAFLFVGEEDQKSVREYLQWAADRGDVPNYTCPFIDPRWDRERVEQEFEKARAVGS
jgi:hypothetical protein